MFNTFNSKCSYIPNKIPQNPFCITVLKNVFLQWNKWRNYLVGLYGRWKNSSEPIKSSDLMAFVTYVMYCQLTRQTFSDKLYLIFKLHLNINIQSLFQYQQTYKSNIGKWKTVWLFLYPLPYPLHLSKTMFQLWC